MNLEILAKIIPGLKEFQQGKIEIALIWLSGTMVGYFSGLIPGIIIHAIYICKSFRKKRWLATSGSNGNYSEPLRIDIGSSSIPKKPKTNSKDQQKKPTTNPSENTKEQFIQETIALTRRQFIQLKRRPSTIITGIIQPLMWLILFGASFQRAPGELFLDQSDNYLQFLSAGLIVFTALSGALFGGLAVMFDREFGFLNRLLVAPLASRFSIVLSSAICIVAQSLIQAVFILIASSLLGAGFPGILELGTISLIIFLIVLGFSCLSLGLAFALPGHIQMLAIIFVLNLPLLFASTAFAPIKYMAPWLSFLASINPLTYAIETIRHLYLNSNWGFGSVVLEAPWGNVNFMVALLILIGFDILAFFLIKPLLNRRFA